MNPIELTAILGSHPLGALASLGLLRVVSKEEPKARLSFVERDDWIAVLHADFRSPDDLLDWLTGWSAQPDHVVLNAFGTNDVRLEPHEYHAKILEAADSRGDLTLTRFLVALAADGATDNAKGLVKPSPFYMASGQQSFIDTMTKICAAARSRDIWAEALFGPWTYLTEESSCGWDPGSERLHALRGRAPTRDKLTCVAGAVRLAFEALPLFPAFSRAGRVQAVAWAEVRSQGKRSAHDCFRWPIPAVPITIEALKLLLASKAVAEGDAQVRSLGVAAVYESVRHEFGQGYGIFRPATALRLA